MNFLARNIEILKKIEEENLKKLRKDFPLVEFSYSFSRTGGMGYFNSLCYKIRAKNKNGEEMSLVDDGISDCTEKLLSDSSERFSGSGLGSEVLIKYFGKE